MSVDEHTALAIGKETIRVLFRRLMPFLILCYFVCFLDRVNIGFAASPMRSELDLTATVFGLGAGIFAVGYILFEVPSNLALHRVGARLWIPRIMVTWGLASAGFAFIQDSTTFIILRFLLGDAEAGFFPGVLLYLSLWFPRRALGRATAFLVLGLPVSMLLGAPLSTGLLNGLDEVLGVAGWRWMFLLEGLLAVATGIVGFFVLTNGPDRVSWLTDRQRTWLLETLERERSAKESVRRFGVLEALRNTRVLALSACVFLNITALYGLTLWAPQIIEGLGGTSPTRANLLTAVPYLCAGVAMVLVGRRADRTGNVRNLVLVTALLGGAGLALAAATSSPVIGLVGLCAGAAGVLSSNALFWSIPSTFLTGAAAAAGIALINSIGNVGGFVGPFLTGWARDAFGTYEAGMYLLGSMAALYGLAVHTFLDRQRRDPRSPAADIPADGSSAG